MKKRFIIAMVVMSLFFHYSYAKKSTSKFFSKANKFLSANVQDGLVDYSHLKKAPKEFNELIELISTINIDEEKPAIQKAYFINVYNILVIKSVIDHYPIIAPLEYIGLFSAKRHRVGGTYYTLNDLEKLIMAKFQDVRVALLLSSASLGSPKLPSNAYEPKKLEKQIEEGMKLICDDIEFVRVAKNTSTILLAESFRTTQGGVKQEELIALINKFRKEPLPTGYRLDFYPTRRQLNSKGVPVW